MASVAFFHNTVAKARARAARASQRGSSKRHGIINPRLEGKLGPTYGIGDVAQRVWTRQISRTFVMAGGGSLLWLRVEDEDIDAAELHSPPCRASLLRRATPSRR